MQATFEFFKDIPEFNVSFTYILIAWQAYANHKGGVLKFDMNYDLYIIIGDWRLTYSVCEIQTVLFNANRETIYL